MEYFVISAKFVPLKYFSLSSQLRRLTSFSVGLFGSANSVTRSYPVMRKSCIGTVLNQCSDSHGSAVTGVLGILCHYSVQKYILNDHENAAIYLIWFSCSNSAFNLSKSRLDCSFTPLSRSRLLFAIFVLMYQQPHTQRQRSRILYAKT